jgi:nitrate reductase NapAB chaperone NapD
VHAGDPAVIAAAPSASVPSVTEAAALGVCGSIVFVVDSTEEAPYAESMEALRRTAAVLMALAATRHHHQLQQQQQQTAHTTPPASVSPPPLPTLEVFIHKVDGDAWGGGTGSGGGPGGGGGGSGGGVSDEGRSELLREVSLAVLRELRDAGES